MSNKEKQYYQPILSTLKMQRLEKSLIENRKIYDTTIDDINKISDKISEEPENQCWHRLFIRTVYSFIESMCFRLKQIAYIADKIVGKKLSRAEVAMLLEESYSLTNSGKVKSKTNYQKSAKNLRFTFKIIAHVLDIDFTLALKDKGWESYLKGLKIRNRVTHPKTVSDLAVSKEDMEIISNAFEWFGKNYFKLFSKLKRINV